MKWWIERNAERRLRRQLRSARSEPRPELVAAVSSRIAGARPAARSRFRLAIAGAISTVALVAAGSMGGVGYAASVGKSAVKTVEKAVSPSAKRAVITHSAARSQYGYFVLGAKKSKNAAKTKRVAARAPIAGISQPKGGLPFTGLALGTPLAVGLVLLGLGIVLRRRTRSREG